MPPPPMGVSKDDEVSRKTRAKLEEEMLLHHSVHAPPSLPHFKLQHSSPSSFFLGSQSPYPLGARLQPALVPSPILPWTQKDFKNYMLKKLNNQQAKPVINTAVPLYSQDIGSRPPRVYQNLGMPKSII